MSARDDVLSLMSYSEEWYSGDEPHDDVIAKELDAYRAEILREAADVAKGYGEHSSPQMGQLIRELRSMADNT